MKSSSQWSAIPFAWIFAAAAAGVAVANEWVLPWWFIVVCTAICFALACAGHRKPHSEAYILAAVIFVFMGAGKLSLPRTYIPQGERLMLIADIDEVNQTKGRWQNSIATVTAYRDSTWSDVRERMFVSIDTCYNIGAGDRIAFRGYVNPFGESSYSRLMARRGVHGRTYLTPRNLIKQYRGEHRSTRIWANGLQGMARERLSRLKLDTAELAIASAMTTGYRGDIPSELRADYSRSGTAHLLAVSGLHVGMVFLLVNVILWLLPLFRRGHIMKNIVAIIIMWLYALMTGMSPSVVRATLMFSGAQIALATTSYRSSLNILFATATIMLAANPNNLYDISFQLSFVAVLFLMLWTGPLYMRFRSRYKLVNIAASPFIVSLIATVATAPLIAYTFGYVSIVGLLVNPFVVLTAHVVVLLSLLWIIAPIGFFAPLFNWGICLSAKLQNAIAGWGSGVEWGTVDTDIPLWGVFAIYGMYLALTVLLMRPSKEGAQVDFTK